MGRYAYFDTSFEYKFAFAAQPSSDIEEFGGRDYAYIDTEGYWAERVEEEEDEEEKQKMQEVLDAANALNTDEINSQQWEQLCAIHGESYVFYQWTHDWRGVKPEDVIERIAELIADNSGLFKIKMWNIEEYIRSFALTAQGTKDLLMSDKHMAVKYEDVPEHQMYAVYKIELGLCIAHQLMYEEMLSCTYEC